MRCWSRKEDNKKIIFLFRKSISVMLFEELLFQFKITIILEKNFNYVCCSTFVHMKIIFRFECGTEIISCNSFV